MPRIEFGPALAYLDGKQDFIRAIEAKQRRFWAGEKPAVPLYFVAGTLPDAVKSLPNPDYLACRDDPDAMLASELRRALTVLAGGSDQAPSIRPNLGAAVTLSCIGLEQEFFPDKMPWFKHRLTLEETQRLDLDAVKIQGTFARGMEMIARFKEVLGDRLAVYPMAHSSPFDVAHMVAGDDIFLWMYDEPDAVHHLMDFITALLEKLVRLMKEAVGEPIGSCHYSNALCSDTFGVRLCEDTSVLLGAEQIAEFMLPYSRRLSQAFGGAWVHYCGRHDPLTDAILAEPTFHVINFGYIPGKDLHDFEPFMARLAETGKKCYGLWPRRNGESARDYLRRLHAPAAAGVLVPQLDPPKAEDWSSPEAMADFWRSL